MNFKLKHDSNEENYWLPATDLMAGIMLFFLLLLVLIILFLNSSKDEVFTPLESTEPTSSTAPYEDGRHYGETYKREDDDDHSGGEEETQAPTERSTEPPHYFGDDEGQSAYAAVFVTVVDAETGRTIKKKGIEFELYADKNGIGGLQTLYTYYPKKTEYKKYQTDENGIFYLPEKITYGWYSLHNLVAPEGYYSDGNTDFEIDDDWHWSEPYMVTVALKPIKNIIRVQTQDPESKKMVPKAVYRVTAAEDIKAADGTVRYNAGDTVDEITTDKNGYAETKELYIGEYQLKQISAPGNYAVNVKSATAAVGKDSNKEDHIVKLECRKTSVTIRLTDERTEESIQGAVYSLEGRDDLTTDQHGRISISELKKSTSYTLKATSLPEGYVKESSELTFVVDGDGLVDGKESAVLEDTAYNRCLSVEVRDLIFGRSASGVDLALVDESGEVVEEWTSNEDAYVITGLNVGRYYIQQGGKEDSRISVDMKDTAELQKAQMRIWDTIDLFALLMLVGAVVLGGLILILMINRRKKVRKNIDG